MSMLSDNAEPATGNPAPDNAGNPPANNPPAGNPPAGNPPAGNPPANNPAPDNAGNPAPADNDPWLPEAFRSDPGFAKFKTVEDLCKSHKHLESMLGKRTVVRPDKNSSPDDWAAWYRDNGVPEEAGGYQIEFDKELPDSLKTSQMADELRAAFLSAHLAPEQAAALVKARDAYVAKELQNAAALRQSTIARNAAALQKEWGEDFAANMNKAYAVFPKLFPGEDVEKSSLANDPRVIRALARAYDAVKDDTMVQARSGGADSIAALQNRIDEIENNPDFRNPAAPNRERLRRELVAAMGELGKLRARVK